MSDLEVKKRIDALTAELHVYAQKYNKY